MTFPPFLKAAGRPDVQSRLYFLFFSLHSLTTMQNYWLKLDQDLTCVSCSNPVFWVRTIFFWVYFHSSPFIKKSWHLNWWALGSAPAAIQEWLLTPTFMAPLPGTKLKIFPGIERHWVFDSEGASSIRALEDCYYAPSDSTVMIPLFPLHCFNYGYV